MSTSIPVMPIGADWVWMTEQLGNASGLVTGGEILGKQRRLTDFYLEVTDIPAKRKSRSNPDDLDQTWALFATTNSIILFVVIWFYS
jgi:hypothetical protein